MRKIYFFPLIVVLFLGYCANAQVIQAVSMSPAEATATSSAAAQTTYTVDNARKANFDYLKATLMPFQNKEVNILSPRLDSVLSSQKTLTKESYTSFLNEVEKLNNNKKLFEFNDSFDNIAKMSQISELKQAFSTMKSAECFEKKENGNYVPLYSTTGLIITAPNGNVLVGADLEPLKQNPRYGLIENYSQGYARFSKDMVYGFMDLCGQTVIQPQYDYAEPFNDGRALVKKYYWHFVDVNGKESEVLEGVTEGKALKYGVSVARFNNQKYALIDNNFDQTKKPISMFFDEITPFIENLYRVRIDKRFGLIKIDGTAVIDIAYDKIYLSDANKWIIIEQDKKVGLLDVDGNTRIKPTYESIASVVVKPDILKPTSIIAKDEKGYRLIELNQRKLSDTYTSIGSFNEFGLAKACKNPTGILLCGYINTEGDEIIKPSYPRIADFSKTGMVVATNTSTTCSMPKGNCSYDIVYDQFGRIIIDQPNINEPIGISYVVTDTILANTLVAIKTYTPLPDGKVSDGYNLVNRINYSRFTKEAYELIKRFDKNYFAIRKNNVWGLIDNFGNEVLAPTYMDLVHSSDGYLGVMYDNEKYGYIDETGKIKITFEYSEINPFENGLAIVAKGKGKYGIINKFNAKIAPCLFKTIVLDKATGNYTLEDRSRTYVLNTEGDCVSDNCKEFYDIVRKANQN